MQWRFTIIWLIAQSQCVFNLSHHENWHVNNNSDDDDNGHAPTLNYSLHQNVFHCRPKKELTKVTNICIKNRYRTAEGFWNLLCLEPVIIQWSLVYYTSDPLVKFFFSIFFEYTILRFWGNMAKLDERKVYKSKCSILLCYLHEKYCNHLLVRLWLYGCPKKLVICDMATIHTYNCLL